MRTNPAHTTENPWGGVQLFQFAPESPVFIWGWMKQLPYTNSKFGFSINERNWNYRDCCTSGKHLQSAGQVHGDDNSDPAYHNGVLKSWVSNAIGADWFHFQYADKPSFFSTIDGPSIVGKAMTVYEFADDYGLGTTWNSQEYGSTGPRIACCEIRQWGFKAAEVETKEGRGLAGELEDDVDLFTVDEYREFFGHDPEFFPGEPGYIDQN